MALAVVQHQSGIHGSQVPGSVTLGTTPTVGNLLIAFLGVKETSYTVGTGWTQFDYVSIDYTLGSPDFNMICLYRYVQPGDTTALPAFMSAGTTYWTHCVYEVSGVSGTWDSDLLIGEPLFAEASNNNLPAYINPVSGALALTGVASYNGGTSPSISGSWTLDEDQHNNSNYGSVGGASRALSAGNTIDGAWSQGTSAPYCGYLLILTPSQPTTIYPRRSYATSSSGTPGAITLPWKPLTGNLLIAYINWHGGTSAAPTIGSGWTQFANALNGSDPMIVAVYRYVQSGDTSTLSALATGGSTFYSINIVELAGGIVGAFANDHISDQTGYQASGSTLTTTADATTAASQCALLAFANYGADGVLSSTTGFAGYVIDAYDSVEYGSWFLAFKEYASSGSTVQGTITPPETGEPQAYIQSIFGAAGGSAFTAAIAETISLSDSVSEVTGFPATVSESISLTDAVSADADDAESVAETISLTDTVDASVEVGGAATRVVVIIMR